MNTNSQAHQPEQPWIHFARILGSLAVVSLHVSALVSETWMRWILVAISIWAVPVFTMVSGALMPTNLMHRLGRILPPALIWIPFYYFSAHWQQNLLSAKSIIDVLLLGQVGHLYYFFILFELALLTPFLHQLISELTSRSLLILITIFALIGFFWKSSQLTVTYFIPYLSYYLIGFYLTKIKISSKVLMICQIGFWISTLLLLTSIWFFQANSYLFQHGNPLIFCLAVSAVIIIKTSSQIKNFFQLFPPHLIRVLADSTLGIYILHPFVLNLILFQKPHIFWYLTPLLILVTFAISLFATIILKKFLFIKSYKLI
ncbi:MAG TPA: hypothetical protein DEP87_04250 [Candidatus Pacebacteria bacterium]|nr:hypothetical protein [Candidatus Paceibacterota bacterium]